MIKVQNLVKSYGNTHVLKGIDLELKEGEVLAIIGPSGSGKSTFLRCLNFLEVGQKGSIEIDGIVVNLEQGKKETIRQVRIKRNTNSY